MLFLKILLVAYIASFVVMFLSMINVVNISVRIAKSWIIDTYNIDLKYVNIIFDCIKDFKIGNILHSCFLVSLIPILNSIVVFDYAINGEEYEKKFAKHFIEKIENKYHDRLVEIKESINFITSAQNEENKPIIDVEYKEE